MGDHVFSLAYGPFPGIELVPYFFGLIAWAILAMLAIFLAPLKALWRRIRGSIAPPANHSARAPEAPPLAEPPSDGGRD